LEDRVEEAAVPRVWAHNFSVSLDGFVTAAGPSMVDDITPPHLRPPRGRIRHHQPRAADCMQNGPFGEREVIKAALRQPIQNGGYVRGYQDSSAPLATPTTGEQVGGHAVC
jgi:hypothetical protein